MQKKKITVISLITIILIFISVMIINYESDYSYTYEKDGIKYAVSVDGVVQTSFPNEGMYRVDVSCKNANCKWLYDEWKLVIENITGHVSCDIDFITTTKNNLNDYITGLVDTNQGNGQVVNENGYRYEGKSPNNYIWFNNELWRIIGVFDEDSHGQSNTNLVKIIRADSIGGLAWDKSITNNWVSSSLNSLLNDSYLNAQDGADSGFCHIFSTSVQGNCDYRIKGIQDRYREMIENVTWYLGGYSSISATAEDFYRYERGSIVYGENPSETTGYIGLMYPSDYGYSVLSSSCPRTKRLGSYGSSSCGGQSWIAGNSDEWTITSYTTDRQRVFYLWSIAQLSYNSVVNGLSVRPVLYLKSDVYVIDGDGSILDPYIISE